MENLFLIKKRMLLGSHQYSAPVKGSVLLLFFRRHSTVNNHKIHENRRLLVIFVVPSRNLSHIPRMPQLTKETDNGTSTKLMHFIKFHKVEFSKKVFFSEHFLHHWCFQKNIKENPAILELNVFLLNSYLIVHASKTEIQTSPKWKIIKINQCLFLQKSSILSKLFLKLASTLRKHYFFLNLVLKVTPP